MKGNTDWFIEIQQHSYSIIDRKSKLSEYDKGEKGPIESFSVNLDTTSDSELDDNSIGDDEEEDEKDEDDEDFVVDDDIIDGEKTTAQRSEMTMMEMPRKYI